MVDYNYHQPGKKRARRIKEDITAAVLLISSLFTAAVINIDQLCRDQGSKSNGLRLRYHLSGSQGQAEQGYCHRPR